MNGEPGSQPRAESNGQAAVATGMAEAESRSKVAAEGGAASGGPETGGANDKFESSLRGERLCDRPFRRDRCYRGGFLALNVTERINSYRCFSGSKGHCSNDKGANAQAFGSPTTSVQDLVDVSDQQPAVAACRKQREN